LVFKNSIIHEEKTKVSIGKMSIDDSPYYVFVALCIVVIVVSLIKIAVSLIKIAASNENIEFFREYFAVGYRAPDPSFFYKFLHGSGQKISHLEYQ
jgi:hypothetical protein